MWPTNPVWLAFMLFGSFTSLSIATRSCFMQDWGNRVDAETACESSSGYYNLVGFERDGTNNLQGIKRAKCCERDRTFWNTPTICQMPDWITSLDSDRAGSWSLCPQGFFLRGMYRSNGNNLFNIEWGKCCKPSHHPYRWRQCYDEDVSNTFNKAGLSECKREGHFIAGFQTRSGSGSALSNIRRFKCCRMVEEIPQLETLDGLKQRVMDSTMFYIGQLASFMGYAWTGGCFATYAGEDFRRKGDTWESTFRSNWCIGNGPKKDVRLKITYGNFAFTMKDVTFGESVKQTIPVDQEQQLLNVPDRSYSKIAENNKNNPGGGSEVKVEMRVASTLKNVQRTSWDSRFGIEAGFEYEPPSTTGGVGISTKTSLSYEWGGDQEETTVEDDWHILKVTERKELPPHTFAEWHAFRKPSKVTIPYTATIVPTFSVKLEGYMKWGGGYHGDSTNFHQQHRGSGDRASVTYTFGSENKPFYEDLKDQIEQNMYPWQWLAMKQHYPNAQYFIDQLINKDMYAFTMAGQFEESTENEIKSYWYPSRPISEMPDAVANLTAMRDQAEVFPEFPRIRPAPPEVKPIDNSEETRVPPTKQFNDDDGGEATPTMFPRIHPPAPEVKPIDNTEEIEPPPVKQFRE